MNELEIPYYPISLNDYIRLQRCKIKAYNDSVDSFSSENLAELNGIISNYNLLPSVGLKELEIKTNILAESDPEVKKLMEISLKTKIRPSVIMQGKEIYKQLSTVEDPEAKNLILHYLNEEGYTPKLVSDEYEIFEEIKNYEYKDENLKNFILSLIKDEEVSPSFIELYFVLFKDKEFGEETENYIRELLNQPKK